MDTKNVIRYPFKVNGGVDKAVYRKLGEVVDVIDRFTDFGLSTRHIILEDFGTWLRQSSWTDESGWYITFRVHPIIVAGRPERKGAIAQKFMDVIEKEVFLSHKDKAFIMLDESSEGRMEVFYRLDTTSIGD